MKIILNGEARKTPAATLGELLHELGFAPIGLAVAVNGQVVRRANLPGHPLRDGDHIEIIRAVQGG